jgi:hypothetical protein
MVAGVAFAVVRDVLSAPLLRDILEVVLYVLLWPLAVFGLIDLSV